MIAALLRRVRRTCPDHACRTPGCPGRGDVDHLMCPDHRATVPGREPVRRWLTNPPVGVTTADDWACDWQGRRHG